MANITFITGGQRSGKSGFAQRLAEESSSNPTYVATARVWDDNFRERIKRHQDERGKHWNNIECEKELGKLQFAEGAVVLLDCITLWLTNFFSDSEGDVLFSLAQAKEQWDLFIKKDINLIVVSNEIGMGLHADTDAGRKFTDLQGWMNQYIAKRSDNVFFMVSGLPLKVKTDK